MKERGQGLVEYAMALLLMFVVIVVIGSMLFNSLDSDQNGFMDYQETRESLYIGE